MIPPPTRTTSGLATSVSARLRALVARTSPGVLDSLDTFGLSPRWIAAPVRTTTVTPDRRPQTHVTCVPARVRYVLPVSQATPTAGDGTSQPPTGQRVPSAGVRRYVRT